jgi:SPP1 family predicted phage head-tail adaptor
MGTIGTMNLKIEIQEPTTTKSLMGAPVKSFAHLTYLWAERSKVSDVPEQYVDNRLVVPSRHKYRVHYSSSIDETMRIVDGSVYYNILSLDRVDTLFLDIIAERITE